MEVDVMRRVEYGAKPKTQGPTASALAPNCFRFTPPPKKTTRQLPAGKEGSLGIGVCPLLSSKRIRAGGRHPPFGPSALARAADHPRPNIFSERQIFYG